MRTGHRRTAAVLLSGLLVAGLGACGGDDDDDATSSGGGDESTDLTAAAPTAAADFCEGFHGLDLAFGQAPEDPAQLPAFITEQVDPNLALVKANIPTEVEAGVTTMVETVEGVKTSGDMSAFQSEEFTAAQSEVYPFLADGCGWQALDTKAVDYTFEGMPETLEAGTTVVTIENASEAGELHEVVLIKVTDKAADLSAEEIVSLPEEEAMEYADPASPPVAAFAAPGASGGVTADLTPGRYIYSCFIPTGTTSMETPGTGQPHFMEGMVGELTVS
jgi:uncharacterized cupredoxin-like copper-binding protein